MKLNELSISNAQLSQLLEAAIDKKASLKFQVRGYSMSPFIKDGDVVTISPMPNASIGLGTPVAFIQRETGRLAIHRIIGRSNSAYLIKGDNTSGSDGFIKREDIVGYVSDVERNDRRAFLGLGAERKVVAFLSRIRILPFIFRSWRLIPHSIRKRILSPRRP